VRAGRTSKRDARQRTDASVLVLLATPAPRADSNTIEALLRAIRADGMRVTTWFLRDPAGMAPDGTWVVDRLRTSPSAQLLATVFGPSAALRWNGLRLRLRLGAADPRVVILDGARGERVVESRRGRHHLVAMLRSDHTDDDDLEPISNVEVAAVIAPPDADVIQTIRRSATPRLELPVVSHDRDALAARESTTRIRLRRLLAIPGDRPLVIGWGDDGWLDGVDVFVRVLWALRHKREIDVDGVWIGRSVDEHESARYAAEAKRCGVDDLFHMRPNADPVLRYSADVALLPYRTPSDDSSALDAIASGLPIVTTPTTTFDHALVEQVDHLDIEATAAAVERALKASRESNIASARAARLHIDDWERLDAGSWVAAFRTLVGRDPAESA
jgi:hypothetical protein